MQGKTRYRSFAGGAVLAPEKRALSLKLTQKTLGVAEPQINA